MSPCSLAGMSRIASTTWRVMAIPGAVTSSRLGSVSGVAPLTSFCRSAVTVVDSWWSLGSSPVPGMLSLRQVSQVVTMFSPTTSTTQSRAWAGVFHISESRVAEAAGTGPVAVTGRFMLRL